MPLLFSKSERLSAKRDIETLFSEGKNLRQGKLLLKYVVGGDAGSGSQVKVLIVVPKRSVRLAVNRNRIKRLLREAFRINRDLIVDFLSNSNKSVQIAVIWSDGSELLFSEVDQLYKTALAKLIKALGTA